MKPKSKILFPKFALEILKTLSAEYLKTYFVGGAVRNVLLGKKIVDVDIATSALPEQVSALLIKRKIPCSMAHANMGVIVAGKGKNAVEITTFRKDSYSKGRFPKVSFVASVKVDSMRRDFTVNALYYSPTTKELLDFHNGLKDLNTKNLKFIGNVETKIKEDPLRIVRAFKFSLQYDLQIDPQTLKILNANKILLKKVSATRLQKEINSAMSQNIKKQLQKVIHSNT